MTTTSSLLRGLGPFWFLGLAAASPQSPAPDDLETFVLQRLGFGPSLADRADIAATSLSSWIEFNLSATDADVANTRLHDLLALYPDPGEDYLAEDNNTVTLGQREIAYGLYSEQPLREQMVDFWSNHFSVDEDAVQGVFRFTLNKRGDGPRFASHFLREDRDFYRENYAGRFEDLLLYSATSPTMLAYLDTVFSSVTKPNENYAREVMELHTLGVGQYYDPDADVDEAAKLFTCWTIGLDRSSPVTASYDEIPARTAGDFNGDQLIGFEDLVDVLANFGSCPDGEECPWDLDGSGEVDFDDIVVVLANEGPVYVGRIFQPEDYVEGPKVFFNGDLIIPASEDPEERFREGLVFLRYLAGREETAWFISSKLIEKFVAPVPIDPGAVWPADLRALRNDCVQTWQLTDGHIGSVLRTIFESPVFLNQAHAWSKPTTPLESVLRSVRVFDYESRSLGVVQTEEQLERVRAAVVETGFYELFREKLPTGNAESTETSSASLLGGIEFQAEIYSAGPSGFGFPWSLLHVDGMAPELPALLLERLYGPAGSTALDLSLVTLEHQQLMFEGTTQLAEVCAVLATFAHSLPQGFLQ